MVDNLHFKVSTNVQVRFADVDALGHVNNAIFLTYFEQARVEYFKRIPSLDFRSTPPDGHSVIVAEIRCTFKSPAYLDETLRVGIRTREIGRSSFTMEYQITEESSGRLVATGDSAMVYFDYGPKKSVEIPQNLRAQFAAIEGRSF